jgi:hypothetical protein
LKKKKQKNFYTADVVGGAVTGSQAREPMAAQRPFRRAKVFCFFFSKKKPFLP